MGMTNESLYMHHQTVKYQDDIMSKLSACADGEHASHVRFRANLALVRPSTQADILAAPVSNANLKSLPGGYVK